MYSRQQIEQQQAALGRVSLLKPMRFEPDLEAIFLSYRYLRLLKRIPTICFVGLALFTLFSVLDFIFLPSDASNITIAIRLLLICPLILCVALFAARQVNARFFIYFYACAYIVSGCAILVIIYIADLHAYSLPYDGILLHLVFGYFLMGLPYRIAIWSSLGISAFYVWISLYMQVPAGQLIYNTIFIISLNFMGAIGCYMQDRARRFLFLNEKLVALAKAKDKKEIAAKTRLVATASHDLRQPLHAMNMLIEALQAQLQDPQHQTLANSLNLSIKQLSQMLSTLLDISKLNAGIVRPKQETLNLSKKIHHLCDEYAMRAKEAGISVQTEGADAVYVRLDPTLFDRILRNVIENIFDHAEATEIKLIWRSHKQTVQLVIVDNGKGINERDLGSIFEEFTQAGSKHTSGMGLGLSIVKQLAELQDIQYRIESHPGVGTSFHLGLRIPPEAERPPEDTSTLKLSYRVQSDFIDHWQNRFKEWGYSPQPLDLAPSSGPLALASSVADNTALLLWEVNEKHAHAPASENQDSPDPDPDSQLMHYLADPSKAKVPLLLLVRDDSRISFWQERIRAVYASERQADTQFRVEVISPQIRPAKLRLLLTYLTGES